MPKPTPRKWSWRISRRPATTTCSRKIRKDFDAKGVVQSDHQIRRTMDELMAQAVADIKSKG